MSWSGVSAPSTPASGNSPGKPFDTPVGRKIGKSEQTHRFNQLGSVEATDASKLQTEDWGLNMEICDIINETDEGFVSLSFA
jgi:hypothetical protein